MGFHQVVNLPFYNIKDYGAIGDDATDNTAAITLAIDAMPNNGATLFVPEGTFRSNSGALDGIPSGSKVLGAGRTASVIKSTTGSHNLLELDDNTAHLTIENLNLTTHNAGGHVMTSLGNLNHVYFKQLKLGQSNPAKSIFKCHTDGSYFNKWEDLYCFHGGATSAPAFDFTGMANANFNANSFNRITGETVSSAAAYFFDFEGTNAADHVYTNYLTDCTFEITNGGCVRIRSGNGFVLRNIDVYDLTTTTASLFYVGAGSGGFRTRNTTFENINRVGGTLGASKYDIELESGKADTTVFINCNKSTLAGFQVELNANSNVTIAGCQNVTFLNQSRSTYFLENPTINTTPTDDTGSGIHGSFVAGEDLVYGDVCYVKSDGKMWKADASVAATADAVSMAMGTIATNALGKFLFYGVVRDDSGYNWTIGGRLYLSLTAGGITQTAPSATDEIVQILGVALSADVILFKPELVNITVA